MSRLLGFVTSELRHHLRRPATWLLAAVMFFLGFLFTATAVGDIFKTSGAVAIDAPYRIDAVIAMLTLVGTAITSAIAGAALLRDFELRTDELLFTTRVRKLDLVLGRFLGAWLVTALVLACAAPGLWTGAHMPWQDPARVGAAIAGTYLAPTLVYVVPTAFSVCALFLAVGVLTRSYLAVHVQGVVLFVAWQLGNSNAGHMGRELAAALLDPFGINAARLVTRYWTVDEQNSQLVGLVGPLLWNRVLWLALGVVALLAAYWRFRMEASSGARRRAPPIDPVAAPGPATPLPPATRRTGPAVTLARFASLTRLYTRDILRARAFLAIALTGLVFVGGAAGSFERMWGTPIYPVTYAVLHVLDEYAIFYFIVLVMYAGELTWRERGLRCDPLIDTTPVSSALTLASKVTALVLALAVLLLMMIGFGVGFQISRGYYHFELDVYFAYLFAFNLPLFAIYVYLAFFFQIVSNNKYIGVTLMVLYHVLYLASPQWGLEHRLLRLPDPPQIVHSQMNGFGPNVGMFLCLTAYYTAFAMLLLAVARLLVPRGAPDGLRARLRLARARVNRGWLAFVGAALGAWLALLAHAYYNIHALHTYRDSDATDALLAGYERDYKRYQALPQPRVVAAELRIDLSPETGSLRSRGSYRLVNRHAAAIDTVHVMVTAHEAPFDTLTVHPGELRLRALEFAGGATLERDDPALRYQIWRLAAPLAPGAETTMTFDLGLDNLGFANRGRSTRVVANGTYIHQDELMPMIGYQEQLELRDPLRRARHGLPARPRRPAIDDPIARNDMIASSYMDWIDFRATVCTAPDQIAVAPGELERAWHEDGRRCFTYAPATPILGAFAVQSARYSVLREEHDGVALEIYHHADHTHNLARMMRSLRQALDYCRTHFGPYPHRHVRITEFPRYVAHAAAFPGTLPLGEGFGFIARVDDEDPESLDYPHYLVAHEVAHQWWGYQVVGARVQGSTMLIESLAQYTALMIMEDVFGPTRMRRFLRHELRGYLGGRAREAVRELPLIRNENQPYIHYFKGSLVFYALKDYIGEDAVNAALRRLVREHAFKGPPFPIADDLVAMLREVTPPQYAYILADMFETITLYDSRVCGAPAVTREGDRYRVRFTACVRKLRAGERGQETPVALADWIDVGVFAAPGPGDDLGPPLVLERRLLTSRSAADLGAELLVEVVVDEPPALVGVDPYNKLIDRDPDDNTARP